MSSPPVGNTLVSVPSPLSQTATEIEGDVPPHLAELAEARRAWKKGPVARAEWKLPSRLGRFTTWGGLPVPDLLTPAEARTEYLHDLGFPGEPPFTRGVQPTMYRGRLWTTRIATGGGSAEHTNARLKEQLRQGQTGLAVVFDEPTLQGYDSDAARTVGTAGVAIDTLHDFALLFDAIPLDQVSCALAADGPACVLLAFYVALADLRGIDRKVLTGTIQNDALAALVKTRGWVAPPRPALRLATDVVEFCTKELPRWNSLSISGSTYRDAGASAAQELAFALGAGLSYVQSALQRGLPVDDFAPRLSFCFDVRHDFFEEIAKLRAARRSWATLLQNRFGAKRLDALKLRTHVRTASAAPCEDPAAHAARTTVQALAAVLGGTQSLHTSPTDASDDALAVALRTQQLLAQETGVASTIDPLGGSYFVEDLTRRLESEALAILERIDALGGMLAALEHDHPQRELATSAGRLARQLERGERAVRGGVAEAPAPVVDEALRRRQLETLQRVKATRDGGKVQAALTAVRVAATRDANVMPALVEAAKAYATVQEMCDVLRGTLGTHAPRPEVSP